MISCEEAWRLATKYFEDKSTKGDLKLVVIPELTREIDIGWIYYAETVMNSQRAAPAGDELVSGVEYDFADVVHLFEGVSIGLGPLLIDRSDGSAHPLGTALPVEEYVANYVRTGNPFNEL